MKESDKNNAIVSRLETGVERGFNLEIHRTLHEGCANSVHE